MTSRASAVTATRPVRETMSAYEKAQIYMQKQKEERAARPDSSECFPHCGESCNSVECSKMGSQDSREGDGNLNHMMNTGTSRNSTPSSSDWLTAWGVDSDMKRRFEVSEGFSEIGKEPTVMVADEGEYSDVGGLGRDQRRNPFSQIKKALKTKLKAKGKRGKHDCHHGCTCSDAGVTGDESDIHSEV